MANTGYVTARAQRDQSITPSSFSVRNRRYILDMFDARVAGFTGAGTGFAVGTTGATNILVTNAGTYEYFILGAGSTITTPVWDAANGNGLDIGGDQVATRGWEIAFGSIISTAGKTRGRLNFSIAGEGTVAGTPPAAGSQPSNSFFMRLKVRTSDASGLNPLAFGFRVVEAFNATFTNYTEYAAFNVIPSGAIGDIQITRRVASGTAANTSTTVQWADNTTREFKLIVSPSGVVQFFLDNLQPTVTVTGLTMTPGAVVTPFCRLIQGTDLADNVWLQEFEAGFIKPNAV